MNRPKELFSSPDVAGVGAVILAAGASTRMGRPKQVLQLGGQTMLGRAASVALEAGCRPVAVVVMGVHAVPSREALCGLDVQEAENQQWESGMSSSVRVGIEALVAASPRTAAVVLMLCDQPFVRREIIAGLVVAYLETGYPIVASRYCYGGSFGALPALFGSAYFGELTALKGEAGAKQVIQNISEKLTCCLSPEAKSTRTRKTISRDSNRRIIPTRPRAQT